jgi:hypothetical protein
MSHEGLSPTTRSILALVPSTPVMLIKKDHGSKRADRVFDELLSLSGDELLVYECDEGIVVARRDGARSFYV